MVNAEPYPAELIERRDVSKNLAVFRFLPTEQPTFTADQYATIGVVVEGDVIERPYSIVSSPCERFLEFTLERFAEPICTWWEATCRLKAQVTHSFS